MVTKLRISRVRLIVAFLLVLCFAMPFVAPIASYFVAYSHTHSCSVDEHKYDCDGDNGCCNICLAIYNGKSRMLYYSALRNSSYSFVIEISSSTDVVRHRLISSVSLVSLKVRLNN